MGLEVTFSPLKTRTRIPGIRRHRSAGREGPQGESGCAALLARPAASGTPAPDTAAEPSRVVPRRAGRGLSRLKAMHPTSTAKARRLREERQKKTNRSAQKARHRCGAAGGRWAPAQPQAAEPSLPGGPSQRAAPPAAARGGCFHARFVHGGRSRRSSAFISRQRCIKPIQTGPLGRAGGSSVEIAAPSLPALGFPRSGLSGDARRSPAVVR